MKRILIVTAIVLTAIFGQAQNNVNIIPLPESVKVKEGKFIFSKNTVISFNKKDVQVQAALAPLFLKLKQVAGIDLAKNKSHSHGSVIEMSLDKKIHPDEGYQLNVNPYKIQIRAKNATGIFYAVQTVLQLLPDAIEQPGLQKGISWAIPCVDISDAPRFGYRGIMLDVARHFMPVEFIKKLIDLLAMQKMNRLHLHLTDSQGWRFESKKYPKLTQIGAYRKGTPLNTTYDYDSRPADSLYGGYYTQQQLRDLVKYAAARFITIVPEIEMPAHSKSVLASYPRLACLDSTGKPFPYPAEIQDEYCTKDETFKFLDDILTEVMDVFPSKYIHIAGDEASKENWKHCPICQKRMKDEHLKNVEELQSYFIRRIEKFVNSKGRKVIGWDEILQGGLAPNATVMSWTGIEGGIKATQQHHNVVMTPGEYCYFDHYQSDALGEPVAWGGLTTLSKVYSYDPVPAELKKEEQKYILGTQGNLWTEFVPNPAKAEYMLFPRAVALAEVAWAHPTSKNYDDFISRLIHYLARLHAHNVNYSKHLFELKLSVSCSGNEIKAALSGAPKGYNIHYTLDGSAPIEQSPLYKEPFAIKQSAVLTAAVLMNGLVVDQLKKAFVMHKATGKSIILKTPPSKYYNKGGDNACVNGSLGNDENFNDGEWLGWSGQQFNAVIDLGASTKVSSLQTRFFHKPSSWIWAAKKITVETSDDNIHFTTVAQKDIAVPGKEGAASTELKWPEVSARYIRITAEPYGKIPSGYQGAGNDAWLFVDELVVE
jgi:hexosaminidase